MRARDRVRIKPHAAPEAPLPPEDQILREQIHLLRGVFSGLTDGVVAVDLEGRFLLFNESARRVLGMGPEDVPPARWTETYGLFLPDASTPYPYERLPLVRALRGETVRDIQIFVRNPQLPDGAWISVCGMPWMDGVGRPQGAIAEFRDITAHKRTDESLRRLSNAVEQTADSVMITDRDGRILYVNPAFESTTGYTRADALGQTPRLLKSGRQDPGVYRKMWAALTSGKVFRGTFVNLKKTGTPYWAEQTITPMRDGGANITHFVSVARDVTELRKSQEREIELRLASRVQQRSYPRAALQIPGVEVAGIAHPCALMCGDYYDFIPRPEGQLAIVVGDVTGHGLGPALVMAETRAYLRSCLRTGSSLDETLQLINGMLTDDLEPGYFVTLLLASLDVSTGIVTYVNAGHPTGYVLDGSGEVKFAMESTCTPLGVLADLRGGPHQAFHCEPGDILVLLSDGILETPGPEGDFFGTERALALVRRHCCDSAQQILEHLFAGAHAFAQGESQQDDMTAAVCKINAAR